MTRAAGALLCILAGIWLIHASITRRPRRYITLSGHYEGKLWVRKI